MKPPLLPLPPNRVRRGYRGGLMLDRLQGLAAPADSDRPEDWIASTVAAANPGLPPEPGEGLARVDAGNGPILLRDLFAADPDHYVGGDHFARMGPELGFLAKLLDSSMRLHVQAHPTAAFAREHLGSRWGKLETYIVLAVRPGCAGTILLGFQRPPPAAEWRRIVFEQDIPAMMACFDPIPVAPGDVFVVPGGLPHAIGAGVLMVEVMEPTDLVVRCEFEREGIVVPPAGRFMGRDPDFAMRIFDYTPLPTAADVRRRCGVTPAPTRAGEGFAEELLIGPQQTDCFRITRLRITGPATVPKPPRVQVAIVAAGQGAAVAGDRRIDLRPGAKFLLPAATEAVRYTPTTADLSLVLVAPAPA
ncbi:MAG: hypothetical protein BIFFINMI_03893 [Phycisphaerae bacterium]|nr:hypothetical protein [Phycisphaerae bacterium]